MKTFADWHCDTALVLSQGGLHLKGHKGHISLEALEKYDSPIQVFAVWLPKEKHGDAFNETLKVFEYFKNEVKENADKIVLTKSYNDILLNKGKASAILGIEGCEALEGSIEKLNHLYNEGMRVATLTWNYKNCVATGTGESNLGGGLTDFGKEAVREMERLGIVVDVSHLSDEGFYDVVKYTQKPFVATHSNSRAICPHRRNLTDDQLKIIGERGGVAGLNMYVEFLTERGEADVNDILRHAEHMLKVCGEDSVCFGCDFDGIDMAPKGMENAAAIENFLDILEKEFGKDITYKIAKGNFMRVMERLI